MKILKYIKTLIFGPPPLRTFRTKVNGILFKEIVDLGDEIILLRVDINHKRTVDKEYLSEHFIEVECEY